MLTWISLSEVRNETTPNETKVTYTKMIMVMTTQPPQERIKNIKMIDASSDMHKIDNDMGQVIFRSFIDVSKKPKLRSIVCPTNCCLG
jgi:hypothetical protein